MIEASSNLRFGPFNMTYPHLKEHAERAKLDPLVNKWELIFDFSLKDKQNYEVIPPSEWAIEHITVEGFENEEAGIVFDFPKRYGGNLSDEKPQSSGEHEATMAAFGIKTGQQAAQAAFEKREQHPSP